MNNENTQSNFIEIKRKIKNKMKKMTRNEKHHIN